jgi:hypothetical protein
VVSILGLNYFYLQNKEKVFSAEVAVYRRTIGFYVIEDYDKVTAPQVGWDSLVKLIIVFF